MERVSDRPTDRHKSWVVTMFERRLGGWLIPAIAGVLALMILGDAWVTVTGDRGRESLRQAIDITREGNLASWFIGLFYIVVGGACMALVHLELSANPRRVDTAGVWGALGVAFLASGAATATNLHMVGATGVSAPRAEQVVGYLGIFLTCALGLWVIWFMPKARWLALLALALLLTSPFAERVENRLVSDPRNYSFVANDQPYRFNASPFRRLWVVSHYKEGSEVAAAISLLAALFTYGEARFAIMNVGERPLASSTASPARHGT